MIFPIHKDESIGKQGRVTLYAPAHFHQADLRVSTFHALPSYAIMHGLHGPVAKAFISLFSFVNSGN
jgi:hypothetical protein